VFERLSKIMQLKKTKTLSEIRRILSREDAAVKARPAGTIDTPAGKKADKYSESVEN
jgi:hypothetical protein